LTIPLTITLRAVVFCSSLEKTFDLLFVSIVKDPALTKNVINEKGEFL